MNAKLLSFFVKAKIALCLMVCFFMVSSSLYASLIGHWKLDDYNGITAADSSGSGNSLTLQNCSFPGSSGRLGNALSFDGINQYMDRVNFSLGTFDFTFAAWIKTSTTDYQGVFFLQSTDLSREARLSINSDGRLRYGICSNQIWKYIVAGPIVTDGQWHHIAVSYKRSGYAALYVDGFAQNATLDISGYSGVSLDGTLKIGYDNWLTSTAYFNGMIDDVRVYNTALDANAIAALYSSLVGYWKLDDSSGTTASDSSDFNNPMTLTGGGFSFPGSTGKQDNALTFGTNKYMYNNNIYLNTSDFTFAAWIKTSTTDYQGVFFLQSADLQQAIRLSINSDGRLRYGICSNQIWKYIVAGPIVTDGQWHHIAVSYKRSGYATLYVDGFAQNATLDISGYSGVSLSGMLKIGYDNWLTSTAYFNGMIDDVRVYNTALSSDAIFNFTALAHWKLDEQAGATSVTDYTGNGHNGTPWSGLLYAARTLLASNVTTDALENTAQVFYNANGDYIHCHSKYINVGTGSLSMSAWVKTTGNTESIFNVEKTVGNTRTRCMIDASGHINYGVYNASLGWFLDAGTQKVNDGTWHHVAVTYDRSNNATLYVDGRKDAELDIAAIFSGIINGISCIGYDGWHTNSYMNGAIDEVYVFDRVLTAAEVESLCGVPAVKKLLSGNTDSRGVVKRPTNFVLSTPGAAWQNQPSLTMNFDPKISAYRANFGNWYAQSPGTPFARELDSLNRDISILPNREYIVSALIRTNFPREYNEIDIQPRFFYNGNRIDLRLLGIPARSAGVGGWQRWENTLIPGTYPADTYPCAIGFQFNMTVPDDGSTLFDFQIADVLLIEKPTKTLIPFARNAGVTFAGSVGNLPMGIVSTVTETNKIRVITSGARYTFDLSNSKILAEQRLENQRPIAEYWLPANSMTGMTIASTSVAGTIISNGNLTIGVEPDSLMIITPQSTYGNLDITVNSKVPTPSYTRLYPEAAVLFSKDEFGGIVVHPDPALGSGEVPVYSVLTSGLDFVSFARNDYQSLSVGYNWQIKWTTKPGQRFCAAVFPGKEYDWTKSFSEFPANTIPSHPLTGYYGYHPSTTMPIKNWIMWNFTQWGWGGQSYSPNYTPVDASMFNSHISAMHSGGVFALPYISAFFYYSRDAQEWINAVADLKNTYNIDGFYTDGIPIVEFLVGYEEMRRARTLFPNGKIIIHDGDGMIMTSPFIHSYATSTMMLELEEFTGGINFNFARYVAHGYRCSNSIGDSIGGNWTGFTDINGNGSTADEKAICQLLWNGRSRLGYSNTNLYPVYNPVLQVLKTQWQSYGYDQYFYDKYYLPQARSSANMNVGVTAMPLVSRTSNDVNDTVTLSVASPETGAIIRYTTDGSEPTSNSTVYTAPLSVAHITKVKAKAFKTGLDASRTAVSGGLLVELEAEDYNSQSGISSGSGMVYNIDDTDWIRFNNIDLDTGMDMVEVDVKSISTSILAGDIEVWVGTAGTFTYLGSVAVPNTQSFSTQWWTVSAPLAATSGTKDVKLIFRAPAGGNAFTVDKVRFYASGQ